jgi:hypothetical protein
MLCKQHYLQQMSLFCESAANRNMDHVYSGGFKIKNILINTQKSKREQNLTNRYFNALTLQKLIQFFSFR